MLSVLSVLATDTDPGLEASLTACDGSSLCRQVYEWSGNSVLARSMDLMVQILLIFVLAWIANRVAQRAIGSYAKRVGTVSDFVSRAPAALRLQRGDVAKRSEARTATVASVLGSMATAFIYAVAFLVALGELDISLGPILAGAGVAGAALGFGAQNVVRDVLAGLFVLIEDQYGVGDIIDVTLAAGTVEKVTLRVTTIRDVNGTVWHVPNGQVQAVGNKSQNWARALIDVEVPYSTDVRRATDVIQRVADTLFADPLWGEAELLKEPQVLGVEQFGPNGVIIRLVVDTEPAAQWRVERELRLRLKEALDHEGIEMPSARTFYVNPQMGSPSYGPVAGGPSAGRGDEPPSGTAPTADATD